VGSNNKRRRKKDELLESGLPGLGASSPGEHKLKVRLSGMTTGTYDDQTMVVLKANRTSFSAHVAGPSSQMATNFRTYGAFLVTLHQFPALVCWVCNVVNSLARGSLHAQGLPGCPEFLFDFFQYRNEESCG